MNMKSISDSQMKRMGLLIMATALILTWIALRMPIQPIIEPVFVHGISFVLGLLGLFFLLRPYVSRTVSFVGAIASYLMLVGLSMFGVNNPELMAEWGGYGVIVVGILAGFAKVFLILGVSHILYPKKDLEKAK